MPETPVVAGTLSAILSALGDMFSGIIGMVGSVVDVIADNPLLLLFCLLPIVGVGIGLFKRLLNVD